MNEIRFRAVLLIGLVGFALTNCSGALSQQAPADNGRSTQRERSSEQPSADQQSNSAADQNLTRGVVESKAEEIAGAGKVTSELQIAPQK